MYAGARQAWPDRFWASLSSACPPFGRRIQDSRSKRSGHKPKSDVRVLDSRVGARGDDPTLYTLADFSASARCGQQRVAQTSRGEKVLFNKRSAQGHQTHTHTHSLSLSLSLSLTLTQTHTNARNQTCYCLPNAAKLGMKDDLAESRLPPTHKCDEHVSDPNPVLSKACRTHA